MSKYNTTRVRAANTAVGPIKTKAGKKPITTHEGGEGARRDNRSELYLLAVSNMVGEATTYEDALTRDDRYRALIRKMAVKDGEWTRGLLWWLRGPEANLRSASLVGAAEYVKARIDAGIHGGNREVIRSVLQRADEPGEMLAYWTSNYGRRLPKPVIRGVADAVQRLYSEYAMLKYDTASHGWRFADVIDLVHPFSNDKQQGDLYEHALDRRHNRAKDIPASLLMVRDNAALRALGPKRAEEFLFGVHDLHGSAADALNAAGMTWEALPSLLGGAWTAKRWEAIIPSMGYMALLRNLRNFDEAKVSNALAAAVAAKLADPAEVAKSRQLPMRYLSAYNAAPSLRWAWALEQALDASLANISALHGRTLIMIDTSGSMDETFSKDGTLQRWDAATVFGLAVARRAANADVVSYSAAFRGYAPGPKGYGYYDIPLSKTFPTKDGESLLKAVERWKAGGYFLGGGTDTAGALRAHFKGHDRVIILTDEQTHATGNVGRALPEKTPLYTWNLAGYKAGHAASGPYRHTIGGLSDASFKLIPLLEAGHDGAWPWLMASEVAA
ncbi:TROVE domain-containing protein [Nocardia sp. NPDC059239]|uniref:TROVE domain-containing protein n=1 Tax=unclassified Nocardia TaxID=2637762 RepID=UPI00367E34B3